MPINETLSQYSDLSYMSTVAVYVLAMVFFLVEQSFGRSGAAARSRPRASEPRVSSWAPVRHPPGPPGRHGSAWVGAAARQVGAAADAHTAGRSSGAPSRSERIGRMGAALTIRPRVAPDRAPAARARRQPGALGKHVRVHYGAVLRRRGHLACDAAQVPGTALLRVRAAGLHSYADV